MQEAGLLSSSALNSFELSISRLKAITDVSAHCTALDSLP